MRNQLSSVSTSEPERIYRALIAALIEKRKAWGMKSTDVASLLCVRVQSFRRWETGNKAPGLLVLIRWADLLGCDLEAVFRE